MRTFSRAICTLALVTAVLSLGAQPTAFDYDLWRTSINGGARTKLTVGTGGHSALLSPDENGIADVYSTVNRPPDLFVAKPGAAGAQLTNEYSRIFEHLERTIGPNGSKVRK